MGHQIKITLEVITELVGSRSMGKGSKPVLSLVPQESIGEFYLPLTAFDYSKTSKSGCAGWLNM